VHRADGDAVEREADDEEAANVVAPGEKLPREPDDADPALPVDIGGAGVAAEAHGDVVLLVEVAVDERVLQGVLAGAEERVGPGAGGGEEEEEEEKEGDARREGVDEGHGGPLIKRRAVGRGRDSSVFLEAQGVPGHHDASRKEK
jgi:hypothetical protein